MDVEGGTASFEWIYDVLDVKAVSLEKNINHVFCFNVCRLYSDIAFLFKLSQAESYASYASKMLHSLTGFHFSVSTMSSLISLFIMFDCCWPISRNLSPTHIAASYTMKVSTYIKNL